MTKHNHAGTPSLREELTAKGVPSNCALARQSYERQLQRIVDSRLAMESAVAIAMVTSAMPGIEVTYLDGLSPNES
jgi:hypothetical protein